MSRNLRTIVIGSIIVVLLVYLTNIGLQNDVQAIEKL